MVVLVDDGIRKERQTTNFYKDCIVHSMLFNINPLPHGNSLLPGDLSNFLALCKPCPITAKALLKFWFPSKAKGPASLTYSHVN